MMRSLEEEAQAQKHLLQRDIKLNAGGKLPFLRCSLFSPLTSEVPKLDCTEKIDCLGTTGLSLVNQVRRLICQEKEFCCKQSDYMFSCRQSHDAVMVLCERCSIL